ncbi:sec-independent protein translocase protein TatB [Nitrosomonas sp. PY1]|uniref:Sec-independent protein translocase protein TatB n=1 Tax=Nitrosomonas sp. PY1 TaxID=1803906 RepID=UPI001FC8E17A|nr:Sec-independent protein translocase protein TatB [Nitrosomonas sp. PY1]GKS68944.1 sec-independent protein translocase protein TatB [Nitrosomonas sp. PY1]
MFDISFMELLVISLVALIVIGPERLPIVAKTLGNLYGRCRSFVYSVRTDIHNEIRMEELKEMQSSIEETVHSVEQSAQHNINQIKAGLAGDSIREEDLSSRTNTNQAVTKPQADTSAKHDSSNG